MRQEEIPDTSLSDVMKGILRGRKNWFESNIARWRFRLFHDFFLTNIYFARSANWLSLSVWSGDDVGSNPAVATKMLCSYSGPVYLVFDQITRVRISYRVPD